MFENSVYSVWKRLLRICVASSSILITFYVYFTVMCILPVAQTLSESASLTVFQKALLLMKLFSFKFAE